MGAVEDPQLGLLPGADVGRQHRPGGARSGEPAGSTSSITQAE